MRLIKLLKTLPFCALLGLPGCAIFSATPHYRGVALTNDQLQQLTPGVSQVADVQALLGPPTFVEPFNQNNWVYVSQITHMRIAQTDGVEKQDVVVVTFTPSGTYQSYRQETLKDSLHVGMNSKTTPVPGGGTSFIQQLIGGVGSYNPLGAASDTSANGTSALGGGGGGGGGGGSSDSGF